MMSAKMAMIGPIAAIQERRQMMAGSPGAHKVEKFVR
jgi:hypothetical protein